jgi:DNA-binding transcriptional LysR family regulator
MELVNLKTLIAIVEQGGVCKAAKLLKTVQSNITARIRKLEKELDIRIFTTSGRNIEITLAGKILYEEAKKIVKLERDTILKINNFKGSYELRIGLPSNFPALDIPGTLISMQEENKNITYELKAGSQERLINLLLNDHIDCALLFNHSEQNGLASLPIYKDRLTLIKPKTSSTPSCFLLHSDDCVFRESILSHYINTKYCDDEIIIMSNTKNILDYVSSGLGQTVLSKKVLKNHNDLELTNACNSEFKPLDISLEIIYKKDTSNEKIIHQFSNILKSKNSQKFIS